MSHIEQWMSHGSYPKMVNSLCTFFSEIKAPGLAFASRNTLFFNLCCAALSWRVPYAYLQLSCPKLRPKNSYLIRTHFFFLPIILAFQAHIFSKSIDLAWILKFTAWLFPQKSATSMFYNLQFTSLPRMPSGPGSPFSPFSP